MYVFILLTRHSIGDSCWMSKQSHFHTIAHIDLEVGRDIDEPYFLCAHVLYTLFTKLINHNKFIFC